MSSPTRKRKVADAKPTWDKAERGPHQKLDKPSYDIHRTYRVRGVPIDLDAPSLRSTLGLLTGLNPSEVHVQSLASEYDSDSDASLRTATVTFDAEPEFTGERLNTTDQRGHRWLLPLPGLEDGELVVDQIFDGFTPLSPYENDEKHAIE